MAQTKGLSDFVLTGCAILPVIGLAFGQPAFALLSHIVLLFGGILIAGAEDDAPFKQADMRSEVASDKPTCNSRIGCPVIPNTETRLGMPLQRNR